jgi:uncharacterized peroxidase-related enzyme
MAAEFTADYTNSPNTAQVSLCSSSATASTRRNATMARLNIPTSVDDAPEQSRAALEVTGKRLGFVPNVHRLLALSPETFSGFIQLQTALGKTLDAEPRDSIALAVSQANGCRYCVCAHSHVASTFNGFSEDEITLARGGESSDPHRQAAATFARRVIETRGRVSDDDLKAVQGAGSTPKIPLWP